MTTPNLSIASPPACAARCPSIHHRPHDPHADRGVAPCERPRSHAGYHRTVSAEGAQTLWIGDARKVVRS